MADKKERERVQIDITDLIEQIDRYPEAAGLEPELWREMTYSQKLRYLLRKQLETVQANLDAIDDAGTY